MCGKYGATGDLEGKAWNDAQNGLPVRFYGPGRRDILTQRAQGRGSGPKSLVSLSSVVLLQRTLIWILRALEVDAHAIRQNGQIPGCRAEGRTSTRDSCVLFDGNTPRSRGRADPIDATPMGDFGNLTVTASTTFLTAQPAYKALKDSLSHHSRTGEALAHHTGEARCSAGQGFPP